MLPVMFEPHPCCAAHSCDLCSRGRVVINRADLPRRCMEPSYSHIGAALYELNNDKLAWRLKWLAIR